MSEERVLDVLLEPGDPPDRINPVAATGHRRAHVVAGSIAGRTR